ncbi:MAG: von Willebrand factor type A domain-containing protein [Planctomycetota bacterium]
MNRHAQATSLAAILLLTAAGCSDGTSTTPNLPDAKPADEAKGEANGEATTIVEPPPPPPPEVEISEQELKESGFDSNQWNSAIGIGGGAGAGGAARGRRSGGESYAATQPSGFLIVGEAPLSTFGADVDTASFTNVRRILGGGRMPNADAVRVEEFVNACRYELAEPGPQQAFAFDGEVGACPWQPEHELVRLSLRTCAIAADQLPPCNLVFLIDTSGSMTRANKLPLLQRALPLMIQQLRPQDRVSIVTYASGVRKPLDSAAGSEQARILNAITQLRAGGNTNGQGGIQAAYDLAMQNRVNGINRVVLATDGDFNIGIRDPDQLETFVAEKRSKGVFLTVLGFGAGNLKEDRLERLANRGDGVYHYVDKLSTARRVLVESFGAEMMTIAKDVKLQAEWNPQQVARYRLLGYENRALKAVEFRDDTKDGGEVGAGHTVTALYQIERIAARAGSAGSGPLVTLRVRYKPPEGDTSKELVHELPARAGAAGAMSQNGRTAATAAALALLLRADPHAAITPELLQKLATGVDAKRNADLIELVAKTDAVLAEAMEDTTGGDTDSGN